MSNKGTDDQKVCKSQNDSENPQALFGCLSLYCGRLRHDRESRDRPGAELFDIYQCEAVVRLGQSMFSLMLCHFLGLPDSYVLPSYQT